MMRCTAILPQLDTPTRVITDAEVEVTFRVYPPEPDVGIFTSSIEIEDVRNAATGRTINRVLKAIEKQHPQMWADLASDCYDFLAE